MGPKHRTPNAEGQTLNSETSSAFGVGCSVFGVVLYFAESPVDPALTGAFPPNQ